MAVIANTVLVVRRIAELQRRRKILLDQRACRHRPLPAWALPPLQLVGMSARELRHLAGDGTDHEAATPDPDAQLAEIDRRIDALEQELLTAPLDRLDTILAVLDLVVARAQSPVEDDALAEQHPLGPRTLLLLERVRDELRRYLVAEQRAAS